MRESHKAEWEAAKQQKIQDDLDIRSGALKRSKAENTGTASIAAIMSTADSLLIAVSQLVTSELFYRKSATRPPSRLRTRCWVAPVRS